MAEISVEELNLRFQQSGSLLILDVREELEFHTFNIGGKNIPLGKLPLILDDLEWDREAEVVVVCQHGIRSKTACKLLSMAGFLNTRNLIGGLLAWRKKFNN